MRTEMFLIDKFTLDCIYKHIQLLYLPEEDEINSSQYFLQLQDTAICLECRKVRRCEGTAYQNQSLV